MHILLQIVVNCSPRIILLQWLSRSYLQRRRLHNCFLRLIVVTFIQGRQKGIHRTLTLFLFIYLSMFLSVFLISLFIHIYLFSRSRSISSMAGLTILETTIGNSNQELWKHLKPQSVLEGIRYRVLEK